MKSLLATFAAAITIAAVIARQVRIRRIEITQPEEGYQSPYSAIQGLRSCGGPGQVVEWRVQGCTSDKICRVPSEGDSIHSELEFIPYEDSDALGVRFILIDDVGATSVYERPIAGSAVQGGERYISNMAGRGEKQLKGKTVTAQYILYRVDDNRVEVCAEADFEVY